MSSSRIIYRSREDATPEGERAALACVYIYLLKNHDSKRADKLRGGLVGRDAATTVRHAEGVSHVEQRPEAHT